MLGVSMGKNPNLSKVAWMVFRMKFLLTIISGPKSRVPFGMLILV
jgi:hypothetical protein